MYFSARRHALPDVKDAAVVRKTTPQVYHMLRAVCLFASRERGPFARRQRAGFEAFDTDALLHPARDISGAVASTTHSISLRASCRRWSVAQRAVGDNDHTSMRREATACPHRLGLVALCDRRPQRPHPALHRYGMASPPLGPPTPRVCRRNLPRRAWGWQSQR